MSVPWNRIEDVFHDALRRSADDRAAFLREQPDDVRAELESLLAAHEGANRDDSPLIGTRVGAYRITREIGRGGMGAIYLAVRDDDEFRKEVAIKVIKRGMDSDAIVRRFRNERQILADLDHQNIARLLDGGTTEDGLPYFVMEYIDGVPLDVYCRPLEADARLALFARVCEAVGYAHKRGVVHRDLKPSNILITRDGSPKLLDFGIAKVFDTEREQTQTTLGQQILTPAYASPEQLAGARVTSAGDVYSLAVMLHEVVLGTRPGTPSQRRSNRDVSRMLSHALDADPSRRYATATEFGEDIRRHLAGEPVTARRQSLPGRAFRAMRKHRGVIFAALLVALTISVLIRSTLTSPVVPTVVAPKTVDVEVRRITSFGDVITSVISPDGRKLIYVRGTLAKQSLWVRDLATGEDLRIAAPGRTYSQLASNGDGSVIFFTTGLPDKGFAILMQAAQPSAVARRIAEDTQSAFGLSADARRIVFRRLHPDGRLVLTLFDVDRGEERALWRSNPGQGVGPPAFAFGDREIILSVDNPASMRSVIWALNPRTGTRRRLRDSDMDRVLSIAPLPDGSGAIVATEVPSGLPKIWWAPWGPQPLTRLAGGFDLYRHATVNDASDAFVMTRLSLPSNVYKLDLRIPSALKALTSGENYFARSGLGYMPDGAVLFNSISEGDPGLLVIGAGESKPSPLRIGRPARMPRINTATRRIAFLSRTAGVEEVWTCDFEGAHARQVTANGPVAQFDIMPDGKSVLYATRKERGVFSVPIEGGASRKLFDLLIVQPTVNNTSGGWLGISPNGQFIVCDVNVADGGTMSRRRAVIRLSDGSIRYYPSMGGGVGIRQWLPDSSAFAFDMDSNVWVQPLDGTAPRKITDIPSGEVRFFAFAPDGKSLLISWGETSRDAVMFRNFR